MTDTDSLTDDTVVDREGVGTEEEPPYGRLDPETASKCGLWLE